MIYQEATLDRQSQDKYYTKKLATRFLSLVMVLGVCGNAVFFAVVGLVDGKYPDINVATQVSASVALLICAAACHVFAKRSRVSGVAVCALVFGLIASSALTYRAIDEGLGGATIFPTTLIMVLTGAAIASRFWHLAMGWVVALGPVILLGYPELSDSALERRQFAGFLFAALVASAVIFIIGRDIRWNYYRLLMESIERNKVDALTALSNRQAWTDAVQNWIGANSTRAGETATVLYMDLDDLKVVNDRDGHPAGDRLLMEVADSMRRVLPTDVAVARFGGDEFVAFLPNIVADEASSFIASLRKVMFHNRHYPGTTLGIGVATYTAPEPIEDALLRADKDLVVEKQARHSLQDAIREPALNVVAVAEMAS